MKDHLKGKFTKTYDEPRVSSFYTYIYSTCIYNRIGRWDIINTWNKTRPVVMEIAPHSQFISKTYISGLTYFFNMLGYQINISAIVMFNYGAVGRVQTFTGKAHYISLSVFLSL